MAVNGEERGSRREIPSDDCQRVVRDRRYQVETKTAGGTRYDEHEQVLEDVVVVSVLP